MREYNLDYKLNSEQILAVIDSKKSGLQFLPSVDHDLNEALNLSEVQVMLVDAFYASNLDNTKPIYLTMVLGGHDILIAFIPDQNGMQPYFIDSVGQDSNPNLEQRRKIAKDVVESLGAFVGDINVIKDISVNQQFREACGLAVVSNILSVQDAFDKGQSINHKILYQGENKEKYFQDMGNDLVAAGVLPDKNGIQRKTLKKKA